jgi:peptidoglycan/xylan/chitin deacetylase (PgdA/CDA1 family)
VTLTRRGFKTVLAHTPDRDRTQGATILIYHRVGGGSRDELDVSVEEFARQVDVLGDHRVVSLGDAVTSLQLGDSTPSVVLTFDDGFRDLYDHAWPMLRDRDLPFTLYLASAYVGGTMSWPGSTARDTAAGGLTWEQVREMVASGLCTLGNHTHSHVPAHRLNENELDLCTAYIEEFVGVTPEHFAYPWGRPSPPMEPLLRERFRSAVTGEVGRNVAGADLMRLRRVPVRGSDPIEFFQAKLTGALRAERLYGATVTAAKWVRSHA